ncbi:MAG: tRNA (N6-threonylcarbamoyladenosine(37)-N6)-methyltransferase TrmO [Desulfosarcinaceae bacterium]|jgi:tRNA-Thr(GGU) m(6)t(6)A37 methyltransferase TsaA
MLPINAYTFNPIGRIHSCFKEKFGIPRQPGLVPAARATVEMLPPYDAVEAFRGLREFSHIWLLFVFHATPPNRWKPTVRPPRLGGNRRQGVFATRSAFRPNPIGQSVVRLDAITQPNGRVTLQISGVDLLDQTPVLDIKPYLPYAEALSAVRGGFAAEAPRQECRVRFAPQADAALQAATERHGYDLPGLVADLLAYDPRPAYRRSGDREHTYGMRIEDLNIEWRITGKEIVVTAADREE